jgi:large subunit ribosomal protein LP2
MKYLAAYCLLVLGGKATPSEGDVAKLLKDVGVEADTEELKVMMKRVTAEGKSIPELMTEGRSKMQTLGGGGGARAAAPSGGDAAAAGGDDKKEDKKEEEEDEGDIDMGGMFGDDEY